ncbi:site-specific integrase [Halodesulfovibrio sp.]|jgi:integrase|uniref:tyrosine-type recombinase/integrase n=1 Tax=Halodesulfovibrio sp. TaxID=1912772 RepID=UPI0025F090AD|nr:site-specific integrase [Halodesulfovibrio sp.]MCT4534777.1 site-specific integrase [Halodesulfovibrio sp.]
MGKEKRKWITSEKHRGVRWYLHESRKHGGRFDRCFGLRYSAAGKRFQPTLGWASKGWTEQKAAIELAKLKDAYKLGEGEYSLSAKRQKVAEEKRQAEEKAERQRAAKITFSQFWEKHYWPAQQHKAKGSLNTEDGLYRNWLSPALGTTPLSEITPGTLTLIKNDMLEKRKTPSTVKYAMRVFSQVWNTAQKEGIVVGINPTKGVSIPKADNARSRFLTKEESELLLSTLKPKSQQTHDMALLALYCGLRFGEIAKLTWNYVDLLHETLTIVDAKNKGKNRPAFMTKKVVAMLTAQKEMADSATGLVFPSRVGTIQSSVSKTFSRTADEMFNVNVTDSRQKVCFHTLRHTFASWLVQRGVDLFKVKELMGHEDIKMTQRYSHLAPDGLRSVISVIED